MKIYDISMAIAEDMQVYKNYEAKKPVFEITRDFHDSPARETRISMDMHTGTHLDMPLHFVAGGESLDKLDLNRVIKPCRVLDLSHIEDAIHKEDLEKYDIGEGETILLKTANSYEDEFNYKFIYLAADAARYLRDKKIDCVGIDALGIERDQPDYGSHRSLLSAGILILEGLRLKDVEEGRYLLLAAPLKIDRVEAAPIRALLLELDGLAEFLAEYVR